MAAPRFRGPGRPQPAGQARGGQPRGGGRGPGGGRRGPARRVRSGPDQGGAEGLPRSFGIMAPARPRAGLLPGGVPRSPAAAEPRVPESPASWSAGTSWDETRSWDAGSRLAGARWDGAAAEVGGAPANGNHHVSQPGDAPPGTAVAETPDAATAEAIRRDPFSTAWLQDEELTSPPDTESGWPDRAEAGPQAAAADSWFTPREKAGRRTDLARRGAAEIQRPAASPPEGQAISRAAWPAPAETPAGDPPGAAAAERWRRHGRWPDPPCRPGRSSRRASRGRTGSTRCGCWWSSWWPPSSAASWSCC